MPNVLPSSSLSLAAVTKVNRPRPVSPDVDILHNTDSRASARTGADGSDTTIITNTNHDMGDEVHLDDSFTFISALEDDIDEDCYDYDPLSGGEREYDEMSFLSAFQDQLASFTPGDSLRIRRGIYAGRNATFVRRTQHRVSVRIEGETRVRHVCPQSLVQDAPRSSSSPYSSSFSAFPSSSSVNYNDPSDAIVSALCKHLPSTVRVVNTTDIKSRTTLMGAIFPSNVVFLDMDQISAMTKLPAIFRVTRPHKELNDVGILPSTTDYHLVATKWHDKAKSITCAYLPSESHAQVRQELLHRVGALDRLVPCKVAARLELLLSTAQHPDHVHHQTLEASNFVMIPEYGNVGCGFIPRPMIDRLLGRPSPLVCALQVRICIPSMGVFKGILMEKLGIDKIELPPSMKKVDAVVGSTAQKKPALLMINQCGIYPYEKRIRQKANAFQDARSISPMARWVLSQKSVSQTYLQQPNRQISSLLGVADPTDGIPPECIFLTGIHQHLNEFGDNVLVSRFPMTEAADARVLPILKERPQSMSLKNWHFLCSKPFGLVIFGNPEPGKDSMPEQISQGDLDGDDYFICWDPQIVENCSIGDRPVLAQKSSPRIPCSDWWMATLEFMTNVEARTKSQILIGRLHDCWQRKLRSGLQQDAIAFGRAFKEALTAVKHGGKVHLPTHLWSDLPVDLRCYLSQD